MKHVGVLAVSLRWGEGDEELVGRLASRDGKTYVEFDDAFLASGRVLSWFLRTPRPGVLQGPDAPFSGLHGVFDDTRGLAARGLPHNGHGERRELQRSAAPAGLVGWTSHPTAATVVPARFLPLERQPFWRLPEGRSDGG